MGQHIDAGLVWGLGLMIEGCGLTVGVTFLLSTSADNYAKIIDGTAFGISGAGERRVNVKGICTRIWIRNAVGLLSSLPYPPYTLLPAT